MWKAALLLTVLLGAIGAAVYSDKPDPRADLVYINRGDISTLDLQKMSWMQDLRAGRTLFEGLLRHDVHSPGYDLKPGVAERWEVSADGLRYEFRLRQDAKWSNGEAVRASDFVYSWRRAMLPDTGCDYTQQFLAIKGAKAFYDWRVERLRTLAPGPGAAAALWAQTERKFSETVALTAPDDRTLRFELERPVPYFLDLCAFAVFYPVYPPLVRSYERLVEATGRMESQSGWTKPGVLISNGPFVLTRWRFKRDLRMDKNPYYWDAASVRLNSIMMPSIEDANAQVLAFRSGAVDWVTDVTPDYRAAMIEEKQAFRREHQAEVDALEREGLDSIGVDRRLPVDPRNTIHVFPTFGTYFYNFNCSEKLADGRDNPFHDARVRRAFAMSIDRERIVNQVRRVGERVSQTLVPPGSIAGYESPKGLAYDPEGARALLAAAGYPGGRGFITVEILFNSDGGHDKMAQAIAKDWETNLGVSVTLRQREVKVFRNDLKNGNYTVSRGGWYGDYGDPTTFLNLNRRDDGNNDRKYDSPDYERLMDAAEREPDPQKRMRILSEAEALIVERDLPLAPIYQYVNIYLFDPHRIGGISSHPRQVQNPFVMRRLDGPAE